MSLSKKQELWVESAFDKLGGNLEDFQTFLFDKNKDKAELNDELVIYFNKISEKRGDKEGQRKFKKEVMKYQREKKELEGNKVALWKLNRQNKDVVKFLNNVAKFSKKYNALIYKLKESKERFDFKEFELNEKDKEKVENLRLEFIETIVNCGEILEVPTYEELFEMDIDELLEIGLNNALILDSFINKGKII